MTRVLDLRDVLELINDTLNNCPTAQQDAVGQGHQLVLHILAQFGDQLKVKHFAERLGQSLRDVSFIAK